ncbi:DUF805 domain-containing protein [Variovorax fucosicus]|uniref:DUF805 domain-containing protein n=1 Tax=Variovorax fucosicus TaxID=3053517 RepID=UPI002578BC76|nr:DUF805 domain-containing protein [Variovorax sp. J22G47]MDM0056085.1 DUF805 domain-containing protein [Variovorax sp. J22G47]
MNFMQAVQVCLSKYVDFSGRARRSEFWWFSLFQFIVAIVASFLGDIVASIAGLALLLPALAVGARRLHDIGKSGWLQLIVLIPLLGILVLIYFWVQPGATESNAHGEVTA